MPSAHLLITEQPLTLSSLQCPLQCPAPAFPYPPSLLGSSCRFSAASRVGLFLHLLPTRVSLRTQPALPDSRGHAESRSPPGRSVLATFLVPKPLSYSFLKSGSFFVPFVFCTDHIFHLQGGLGHRRHRTLPTILPVSFSPRTSGSALWSPTLGAGPVMAVNVPPASEGPRWD